MCWLLRAGAVSIVAPWAASIPLLVALALTRGEPGACGAGLLLRAGAPPRGTLSALRCTRASTAIAERVLTQRRRTARPLLDAVRKRRPVAVLDRGGHCRCVG